MKTLVKKKQQKNHAETDKVVVAQCCAKISKTVAGCHD